MKFNTIVLFPKTFQLFSIVMMFLCSCNTNKTNETLEAAPANNEVKYEEAKMTVADQEAGNPLQFLDANGEYRHALLGGNFKIMGHISSKATEVTYKDVVVEFTYYSKTQSVIDTERRTFYEYIKPMGRFDFEFKVTAPSGTESIGWDVVEAKVN